jgi:hypothetical protein
VTESEEIQLETEEGWRPGSSGGERILVVLAAIALVGAVLIVAGNVLKRDETASVASASPHTTSGATPTQRPTPVPTPQELDLVPQSAPSAEPEAPLFNGWIRTKVDLPIKSDANDGSVTVRTLPAGSTVYVDEQADSANSGQGWLYVEGPGPGGYLATLDAGTDLVHRYPASPSRWPGGIWSIAAGPRGLVAMGSQAGRSDRPYPAGSLFASGHGVGWYPSGVDSDLSCCLSAVAWGPAGWLLVGTTNNSEGVWIWSSQDGEDWRALGVLGDGYPDSLTGSEKGYLLAEGGGSGGRGAQTTWFSTDGGHWTSVDTGLQALGHLRSNQRLAATDVGFYAWTDAACCDASSAAAAAFSPDGRTWSPVSAYPNGSRLQVTALGGSLIGINTDENGASHAFIGSVEGKQLSWHPMPGAANAFGNAVVSGLVSDGRHAIAFGWDRTSEAAMAWVSDGGSWSRTVLPGAFGGIPTVVAGGPTGVAVVGHDWNAIGDNPVLWHWNGAGSWAPELAPVIAAVPVPSAADCPHLPNDGVSFVSLDHALAVACFGDAPITVRLWSNRCDGCSGEQGGTYEEGWLAAPTLNALQVSPVQWLDQSWATAILDPSLGEEPDPGWTGTWLELTGHFDDPRAADCRWIPDDASLAYYGGARQIVESCRQQFVVTRVQVVDGP